MTHVLSAGAASPRSAGPTGEQPKPPIDAVLRLAEALAGAGISYCHWKSNEAMGRTLSAENDLDLLVSRADASRFNEVLHSLGYRVARPQQSRHVPGMVDHYLLDAGEQRMVHVQAHYQLVLGDDMTKNFRLPIEEDYLASCRQDGPLPVPAPEMELFVFILRMAVKHCAWDAQVWRKGRLGPSERRELVWLEERADLTAVEELRATYTPFVPHELFARCRAAIDRDAGRVLRARTGRRLLRALEPLGRAPERRDLPLRMWRRIRRRHEGSGPASRRALDNGGLFVAIVGGDGSGKSSAVAALGTTFSRHFPTKMVHLGKPPRSLLTRAIVKCLRTLRSARGVEAPTVVPWVDWTREPFPGLGYAISSTLTARDRARAALDARRSAGRGWLVISDRFPLDDIALMDSPRCAELPGVARRPLVRWLSAREAGYYRLMGKPDVLIVLRVDPEVAVERRTEQDSEFVRRRAAEIWTHDWTAHDAVVLDAGRSREEVLADIHRAVWQRL